MFFSSENSFDSESKTPKALAGLRAFTVLDELLARVGQYLASTNKWWTIERSLIPQCTMALLNNFLGRVIAQAFSDASDDLAPELEGDDFQTK